MKTSVVHVVDDDAAVLRSLGRLLRSAGHSASLYASGGDLLGSARSLVDGCVLMDVRMPEMDGLVLIEELRRRAVGLPVILMTGRRDIETAVRAARLGVLRVLEKPFLEEQLFRAIDGATGSSPPHPDPRAFGETVEKAASRIATLSKREREVLTALARGDAQKVIAFDLGISVRTVEVHRARMLRRLGVRNLALAIRLAAIAELGRYPTGGTASEAG